MLVVGLPHCRASKLFTIGPPAWTGLVDWGAEQRAGRAASTAIRVGKVVRLGHRYKLRPPEGRCLVASGRQRCGEAMDATISTTLEADPRPFACQGGPADGHDAGEGPFWECKKVATVAPSWSHFGGRRAAPVWGPCVGFPLARGCKKRTLFWPHFLSPEATAVWQWFHFLVGQVPSGHPVLRLILDRTSVRFWYEPRLGLRRPRGQGPLCLDLRLGPTFRPHV